MLPPDHPAQPGLKLVFLVYLVCSVYLVSPLSGNQLKPNSQSTNQPFSQYLLVE
jgi:hypothetical protein